MRDLTEEELKLAPDWATDYSINDEDDDVIYESQELCWWSDLYEPIENFGLTPDCKPIIKKHFHTANHEFSDGISISNMCKLSVEVEFNNNDDSNYVPLHKDDVIVIAKALGVTGEDLK